jgi:phosphate transport system permease protein
MNVSHFGRRVLKELRSSSKTNATGATLCFVAGGLVAALGLANFVDKVVSWASGNVLWGLPFNSMMADSVFSLLVAAIALPFFLAGYLMLKSHYLGIILQSGLGLSALSLFLLANPSLTYVLVVSILCFCATGIGVVGRWKTPSDRRDSPAVTETVVKFLLRTCGLISIGILVGLTLYISARGLKYVTPEFIVTPWIGWRHAADVLAEVIIAPLGGLSDFILGSIILVTFCELIAVPLGIGAAIYMAEYSSDNALTRLIRFFVETLAGVPSVVIGLVGFGFFVMRLNMGRSLLSGALSLAFMILPWNVRVAEEAMKAVPNTYREASYALGATRWQTIRHVVIAVAIPGIITGIVLGLGGAIGETAVVLLTAGDVGVTKLPANFALTGAPIPTLPVWIYGAFQFLISFRGEAGKGVWEGQNATLAGSFVLLVMFLIISVVALLARNHFQKKLSGQ